MVAKLKLTDINPNTLMLIGGGALVLFVMAKGWKGAGAAAGGAVVDLVTGFIGGTIDGVTSILKPSDPLVAANNTAAVKWGANTTSYGATKDQILNGNNAWGVNMKGGW